MAANKPFAQRDIAAKEDFRGAAYEPPQTVTATERLELMRGRVRPKPQMHLRPKGIDHGAIQSETEKRRERRIDHIGNRLAVADLGLNRDRMKAVNKDRAKASFNKTSSAHDSNQTRLTELRAQRKGQPRTIFNHNAATKSSERTR